MENNSFMKGRDSLLQTLRLLKDEEEFQQEFGGFEKEMEERREKSVHGLCAMIGRLTKKVEVKMECVGSLEDVNKFWKVIQEERGKLHEKIAELERDKKVLELRMKSIEEELKDLRLQQEEASKSANNSDLYHTALRGSSDDEAEEGGSEESHNDNNEGNNSGEDFELESHQNPNPFYTSRFDEFKGCTSKTTGEMFSATSSSSQKPNFNFPLLTGNPYEKLDLKHYNPTQFFQRQSSTFRKSAAKNWRGGRGGGKASSSRGGAGGKRRNGNNNNTSTSSVDGGNKKPKRGTTSTVTGIDRESTSKSRENEKTSGIKSNTNTSNEDLCRSTQNDDENEEASEPKEFPEDDSSFFDYSSTIIEDASDYLPDI